MSGDFEIILSPPTMFDDGRFVGVVFKIVERGSVVSADPTFLYYWLNRVQYKSGTQ